MFRKLPSMGSVPNHKRRAPIFVWGLVFCFSLSAMWGQKRDCSVERMQKYASLIPVMQGPFADPILFERITRGYALDYQLHRYQEAEQVLQNALASSIRKKNRCAEGLSAYALGTIAINDHLSDAGKWLHQAEAAFGAADSKMGVARAHYELAYIAYLNGRLNESALKFGSAASELEELGDSVGGVLARLQQVERSSDNPSPDAYEPLLTQAGTIPSPYVQAVVLHAWGDDDNRLGHYAKAMEHYEASDKLFSACRCALADRSYLQTSMGRVERLQGRPQAALPHYRLAMRLQMQAHDFTYLPQTINAMAVAYGSMHNYALATVYYKRALAVAHQIHSTPFIQFLEANLGYAYFQMGKPALAIPLLERAVSLQTTANGHCTREGQLADAYLAMNRFRDAESEETRAIAACEKAGKKDDLSTGYATRAKARMNIGKLDDSLSDIRRSKSLIEEIRADLAPEDAYKQGYSQRNMDIFDTIISILTQMYRNEEALETAEQARARAFLDLLSAPHPSAATAVQQRNTTTPLHGVMPIALRDSPSLSGTSRESLLKSDAHAEAIQPGEITSTLNRLHSTLLSYWIANDKLYIWVARLGEPIYEVSQTIKPSELAELVRKTQSVEVGASRGPLVRSRGTGRFVVSGENHLVWRKLYNLLILPVADHLPKQTGSLLTIIPSGPLFRVAFPALIDRSGHYLIEKYAIHTSPAVGLLRYTEENDRTANGYAARYIFVGNPAHLPLLPQGFRLPPLPGAEAEVKAVSQLFPASQVTLLDRNHAGMRQLEESLPEATVLHFATHAVINDADPFSSFLALNREFDGGELTVAKVYGLRLHTKLVVLSACRSGLGEISGDGVAGFTRAFFYSGTASVLAALWDVADEPTARLLPDFYRNLIAGQSRTEALRNAQLSLISDLRHGKVAVSTAGGRTVLSEDPLFWAAFSLSGEP
jgi:CHAT domain-containing protein/tetratricopeptide (TPR) repeat protein